MGLDLSFLQSFLPGDNKIGGYGIAILPQGVNLSKLGITQDMIEKAVDPSRVSVASNYMYEKASVTGAGDSTESNELEAERAIRIECPQICERTGIDYECLSYCNDCNNDNVCDGKESTGTEERITSTCPEGYCPDSNNDGVCDSSSNVIGVTHIGWLSRDPEAPNLKGRQAEYGRSVEDLTGIYSESPSCCQDFNDNGYCDDQEGRYYIASTDILKIGVVWLMIDYSLPQVMLACNQQSCQAKSKPIGTTYSRDGRIYQEFSECSCVDNACRCENVERLIGEECDQEACGAKGRVIDTYTREDKIYQEVRECNCADGSCNCEIIEKLIGTVPILPPPKITVPGLGNLTFKLPDSKSLVDTSEWGEVPPNQVMVEFYDNVSKSELEAFADSLGGRIVGYDDSINLYQIETSGKTEADLKEAILKAEMNHLVKYAFPNQEVYFYISPLDDPIYSGDGKESYDMVGVKEAWDLIKSSGLSLSKVCVGVTDDGLYKGFGEFNNTKLPIEILECSELDRPVKKLSYVGSHGTGIMNIISADPDNGGIVGIASEPLRENLTVFMCNFSTPYYSSKAEIKGNPYSKALESLGDVIQYKASILSISWGTHEADPRLIGSFKDQINRWSRYNQEILLICAVPDDVPSGQKKELDGNRTCPSGFDLPNVITVSSIMNNGSIMTSFHRSPNYDDHPCSSGRGGGLLQGRIHDVQEQIPGRNEHGRADGRICSRHDPIIER